MMRIEGPIEEACRDCERLHLEGYDDGHHWNRESLRITDAGSGKTTTNEDEVGKGARNPDNVY
jgi:hypothetical protein